jgi:hypothetical protein
MARGDTPYEIVVGRGSRGNPLRPRSLVAISIISIAALAVIVLLDKVPVPRPAWLGLPFILAIVWLFAAYMTVWRELMLRVYRRLAIRDLSDQQRFNRWFAAFFAFLGFTLAWLSAFIVVFGRPD